MASTPGDSAAPEARSRTRRGYTEAAARIGAHVEVTAIDRDEADQLDETVGERRATLGSRVDGVVHGSEHTRINDVFALGDCGLGTRLKRSVYG